MKKLGKIIICVIVVILAIALANRINKQNAEKSSSNTSNFNQNQTNVESSKNTNQPNEDEYIGLEENIESSEKEEEKEIPEDNKEEIQTESTKPELTGKDKAVDIVQKEYATIGQTVTFDHMEGTNYVIKMNAGTAVTWYIVNGTTWEAEEY